LSTQAQDNGNNSWNVTPYLLNSSGTPNQTIIGTTTIGGNFWSDYIGSDSTGNGIGNTLIPHSSNGGIAGSSGSGGDNSPLTTNFVSPSSGVPSGGHGFKPRAITYLIELIPAQTFEQATPPLPSKPEVTITIPDRIKKALPTITLSIDTVIKPIVKFADRFTPEREQALYVGLWGVILLLVIVITQNITSEKRVERRYNFKRKQENKRSARKDALKTFRKKEARKPIQKQIKYKNITKKSSPIPVVKPQKPINKEILEKQKIKQKQEVENYEYAKLGRKIRKKTQKAGKAEFRQFSYIEKGKEGFKIQTGEQIKKKRKKKKK